jgi:hypothetical protein
MLGRQPFFSATKSQGVNAEAFWRETQAPLSMKEKEDHVSTKAVHTQGAMLKRFELNRRWYQAYVMDTYISLWRRGGWRGAIAVQTARQFDIILHSVTIFFSPGGRLSRIVLGLGNTARDFSGKGRREEHKKLMTLQQLESSNSQGAPKRVAQES